MTVQEIRNASRLLVRELGFLTGRFEGVEASPAGCHALVELGRAGRLSGKELAAVLRLDKSTVSRLLKSMERKEWVRIRPDERDRRVRYVELTAKGEAELERINMHANGVVAEALSCMSETDARRTIEGIDAYARALAKSRAKRAYRIREMREEDSAQVSKIVRRSIREFGAPGQGFAIDDAELDDLYSAYQSRAKYLVVERDGEVLGGGGYGPLRGAADHICELRKLYFTPSLRGSGLGRDLVKRLLPHAKADGYTTCYLETIPALARANRLYESLGFQKLDMPMGETGHHACSLWYAKAL